MSSIFDGIEILTEGSTKLGFGRIRRSITLAKTLQRRIPVKLKLVSDFESVNRFMANHLTGLSVIKGDLSGESPRMAILDLEIESMRENLQRATPTTRLVCLDWFNPELLPHKTFNLIDHSGRMQEAYRTAGRSGDYIEGPECAIIRGNIRSLRPSKAVAATKVRHILVSLGGADPSRRTIDALRDLATYAGAFREVTVVIGPLVPELYESEIRSLAPSNSRVLKDPPDYEEILASADLVICGGGGTLLESMCLGKPTVVYPQTSAEENHALYHAEAGACVMETSLPETLNSLEIRDSLVAKAHLTVDGLGAIRIADSALNLLQKV